MDDFEIIIKDTSKEISATDKDIDIIVSMKLVKEIEKFAKKDTSCERGGILLGNLTEEDNKYIINIEAKLEAKYSKATSTSLTFTHDTWEYFDKTIDKDYPEFKIVGWFHTHPGLGVFLSGMDLFIHRNFFNLPWQIAYVVDPIANEDGFFAWDKKDIKKSTMRNIITT